MTEPQMRGRADAIAATLQPHVREAVEAASRIVSDAHAHALRANPLSPSGRQAMREAKARVSGVTAAVLDRQRGIARVPWGIVAADAWRHYRAELADLAHPEPEVPAEFVRRAVEGVRINGVRPEAGLAAVAQKHERILHASMLTLASTREWALGNWAARARSEIGQAVQLALTTGAYRVDAIVARLAARPEYLEPDPTMEHV